MVIPTNLSTNAAPMTMVIMSSKSQAKTVQT